MARLAGACPEVTVVLDHVAKPSRYVGAARGWAGRLARVAAEPNTVCKLSGLMTEPGFTENDAGPVIGGLRTAIGAFGPRRCMFGSDWPVLTTAVSYQWWADAVREAISDLPPADQRMVMGVTAAGTYRIAPSPPLPQPRGW